MVDWTDLVSQNNAAASPQTQANVSLLQQQAQAASIANRVQSLRLQYATNVLANPQSDDSGVQQPGPGFNGHEPDTDYGVNPGQAMDHFAQNYAPLPPQPYSQREIQSMQAAAVLGQPELAEQVKAQHALLLENANGKRANAARAQYNDLNNVANSDHPLAALAAVDPDQADRLEAEGVTDDDLRQHSAQLASALHIAARLPVKYQDGVAIDESTGSPLPGGYSVAGLGPKEISALMTEMQKPVDTYINGVPAKIPLYQQLGYKSAEAGVQDHAAIGLHQQHDLTPPNNVVPPQTGVPPSPPPNMRMVDPNGPAAQLYGSPLANGGTPGASPPGAAAPGPQVGTQPTAATPPQAPAAMHPALVAAAQKPITVTQPDGSTAQVPQYKYDGYPTPDAWVAHADALAKQQNIHQSVVAQAANVGAQAHANASAGIAGTGQPGDPALSQALSDTDYRQQTPKVAPGVSLSPAQQDQQKATVAARTGLAQDSQDATKTAAQSLTYLNAAKAIMDSKGAPVTGPLGNVVAQVSRTMGLSGGVDATNYQEVAKYLGNAALQTAKQTYGAKMTQSEVKLQLEDLSPSTHMTDQAIGNLLSNNIRNAQYTIDSAQRVRKYLNAGNDPQSFAEWNEKYFPMSKAVNTSAPAPANAAGPSNPRPSTVAGAPTEGATSVSKSGKPIVYSGGHWQYR